MAKALTLYELTEQATKTRISVETHISKMKKKADVNAAVEAYVLLRWAMEGLAKQVKAIAAIEDELKREYIPELFEAKKTTTVTQQVGDQTVRVTTTTNTRARMTDAEAAKNWLRENGFGDIVTETVNASTLSAFANDLITNHGRELPTEEGFEVYEQQTTSVTKVKRKK